MTWLCVFWPKRLGRVVGLMVTCCPFLEPLPALLLLHWSNMCRGARGYQRALEELSAARCREQGLIHMDVISIANFTCFLLVLGFLLKEKNLLGGSPLPL